jgi:hypothetical protein
MTTRALDHLVMPTADLSVARARLAALGFTVAPDGIHPFGTANCCVYFPGGTFLEPLAVADGVIAAQAIRAGNVFVARDHVYRAMRGNEGFSAIVLASDDADADHAAFAEAEHSGGDMLVFSRPVADPTGKSDVATFKLAFAAEPETADAFLFSCQRLNAPRVDRTALERHANGVTAIAEIVIAEEAGAFLDFVGRMAGSAGSGGKVELANAVLRASVEADPLEVRDGPTLGAIVFAAPDLAAVKKLFDRNDVTYRADRDRLIVQPAPGQGATFIFEAKP